MSFFYNEVRMGNVLGIVHIVSDLSRIVFFYTSILDFKEEGRFFFSGDSWERLFQIPDCKGWLVKLRLGDELLYLIQFLPGYENLYQEDSRSHDLWFQHIAIVVSDMDKAYARLMKHGIRSISHSPQTIPDWNESGRGVKAFYFRSPDGHPLELIYFPEGKGDSRWHNQSALFLGIDHTAIGVAKTEESLRFYRDVFGMHIAGSSLNYGEEQEKISGVLGANVQITLLHFSNSNGLGIELLEYRKPLDGRKKKEGVPSYHLTETHTIICVEDIDAFAKKNEIFLSSKIPVEVIFLEGGYEFKKGFILIDPDGHRILVIAL